MLIVMQTDISLSSTDRRHSVTRIIIFGAVAVTTF